MFEYLRGRLLAKNLNGAVIDVNGVGYGVTLPVRTLMKLPRIGEEVAVFVHTRVREDSITLYGFLTPEDRSGFEFLLQVSGVGPKAALAVFSALSYEDLVEVLKFRQIERLQAVPGLGKKTAEKIVFELESKADKLVAASMGTHQIRSRPIGSLGLEEANESFERSIFADLRSALENLGYKERELKPVLESLKALPLHSKDLSDLLRSALQLLSSPQERKGASANP